MQIKDFKGEYTMIRLQNTNINSISFKGVKEISEFRKEAKSIINDLKNVQLGSSEFVAREHKNDLSLRDRLLDAIFVEREVLGSESITDLDRKLHEKLKSLYKKYQEAEDYAEAMCGGGGHFVDQTIDYNI